MSMHHKIARLEEENRGLRNQIMAAKNAEDERRRMVNERKKMVNERIRMENERIRMENAADCISRTEAATAERERKENIRKNLEEEAKMIGKMCGMTVLSRIFSSVNKTNQNRTNIQSIESAPETPKLPSPQAPSNEIDMIEKACLINKILFEKTFEENKIKMK